MDQFTQEVFQSFQEAFLTRVTGDETMPVPFHGKWDGTTFPIPGHRCYRDFLAGWISDHYPVNQFLPILDELRHQIFGDELPTDDDADGQDIEDEESNCQDPCHPDDNCPECQEYWDRMRSAGLWKDGGGWTDKGMREMLK